MLRDDLLSAYLDGELDAEQRTVVERQLGSDQGAVTRLERMRTADSLLRQAFPATAQVKDSRLAAMILEPNARVSPRDWATRLAPLAAALVLGLMIGQVPRIGEQDASPFVLSEYHRHLLDTTPSGELIDTPDGAFEVAFSVQTQVGPCREFQLTQATQTTDILACRDAAESWRMVAAVAAPNIDGYVPAEANSAFDAALAERGSAEALDRSQERALIDRDWR